jgi:hypothetical protein
MSIDVPGVNSAKSVLAAYSNTVTAFSASVSMTAMTAPGIELYLRAAMN